MKLSQLEVGETGIVKEFTDLEMSVKLMEMGCLPGEHSPDGPVAGIAGLKFSSNGRSIAWQRDLDNMHAFHLTIPSGAAANGPTCLPILLVPVWEFLA